MVIHGIGEQRPMDTITDFVRAVWETDPDVCRNGKPLPAETWSKPDVRTGSLELRRITTRESTPTPAFPRGVRSDFYELYWADLSAGSTWGEVRSWVAGLLCRNPFTSVPRDVMLAWIALWVLALVILALLVASVLPRDATIFRIPFRDFWPFSFLLRWQTWELAAVAAVLAWLAHSVAVPYAGRVVRYTRATPDNIAARKDIRERGLALLDELHRKDYQRIIVVGHSLGSILAYDLVGYFWARRDASRTLVEGTAEFEALRRLEQSLLAFEKAPSDEAVAAFRQAQQNLSRLLRQRPPPQGERAGRAMAHHRPRHARFAACARRLPARRERKRDGRADLASGIPHLPAGARGSRSMVARRGEENRSSARRYGAQASLFSARQGPCSGSSITPPPSQRSAGPISMIPRRLSSPATSSPARSRFDLERAFATSISGRCAASQFAFPTRTIGGSRDRDWPEPMSALSARRSISRASACQSHERLDDGRPMRPFAPFVMPAHAGIQN